MKRFQVPKLSVSKNVSNIAKLLIIATLTLQWGCSKRTILQTMKSQGHVVATAGQGESSEKSGPGSSSSTSEVSDQSKTSSPEATQQSQKAEGVRTGSGGDALVCKNKKTGEIESVELWDYVEAKVNDGLEVDLGAPTLSVKEKLKLFFDRLKEYDPKTAKVGYKAFDGYIDDFIQGHSSPDGVVSFLNFSQGGEAFELEDVTDANRAIKLYGKNNNCEIVQVARQEKEYTPMLAKLTFDPRYTKKMDNDNLAGLLIHEFLIAEFYDAESNPFQNTDAIRKLHALVATNAINTRPLPKFDASEGLFNEKDYRKMSYALALSKTGVAKMLDGDRIVVESFSTKSGTYGFATSKDYAYLNSNHYIFSQDEEDNGSSQEQLEDFPIMVSTAYLDGKWILADSASGPISNELSIPLIHDETSVRYTLQKSATGEVHSKTRYDIIGIDIDEGKSITLPVGKNNKQRLKFDESFNVESKEDRIFSTFVKGDQDYTLPNGAVIHLVGGMDIYLLLDYDENDTPYLEIVQATVRGRIKDLPVTLFKDQQEQDEVVASVDQDSQDSDDEPSLNQHITSVLKFSFIQKGKVVSASELYVN